MAYFNFSIGNFCHRKRHKRWVLSNSAATAVVHDMGLCFAWDWPSISWGTISVIGLQHSLGWGSLQLYLFYHIQGNFLLFTLRWVSWLHSGTELSREFETLNISSPSKRTHTGPLVTTQNWRHSPSETPGMCFSCSLSKGSCAVWRESGNRWVRPVLRGTKVMLGSRTKRCLSFLQLKLKPTLWSTRALLPGLWLPPHSTSLKLTPTFLEKKSPSEKMYLGWK